MKCIDPILHVQLAQWRYADTKTGRNSSPIDCYPWLMRLITRRSARWVAARLRGRSPNDTLINALDSDLLSTRSRVPDTEPFKTYLNTIYLWPPLNSRTSIRVLYRPSCSGRAFSLRPFYRFLLFIIIIIILFLWGGWHRARVLWPLIILSFTLRVYCSH